jgi:hypothetical protein
MNKNIGSQIVTAAAIWVEKEANLQYDMLQGTSRAQQLSRNERDEARKSFLSLIKQLDPPQKIILEVADIPE